MSEQNNPNDTRSSRNRVNNNRRENVRNSNAENAQNGEAQNQVSNLPLPVQSLRTVTGFHSGPGFSQVANNQNIHRTEEGAPNLSPPQFLRRSLALGIGSSGLMSSPFGHQEASLGQSFNNNTSLRRQNSAQGILDNNNSSFLPMRTMSFYPGNQVNNTPTDILTYLESQGVPLNTPLHRGDSGRGPIPGMSIYVSGATPEQMEDVYLRERARMLYRSLADRGYFAAPQDRRRPLRQVLGLEEPPVQVPSLGAAGRAGMFAVAPRLSGFVGSLGFFGQQQPPQEPLSSLAQRGLLPSNRGLFSSSSQIPIEEGGTLYMSAESLGENAVDLEKFTEGEDVEVLYSEEQVAARGRGEVVAVKPSMVLKSGSVQQLMNRGFMRNPTTQVPIALRERRKLTFIPPKNNASGAGTGGKRKVKKSKSRKVKRTRKH